MARSSRERVRKWREKKAKKGGRSLSTWLEPETAKMMDYLLDYYGDTAGPLIARALTTLYNVTCNETQRVPDALADAAESPPQSQSVQTEIETMPPEILEEVHEEADREAQASLVHGAAEADPFLQEIREELAQGKPFREVVKTLLVDWIKIMQRNGMSFQEMAILLNDAHIPTLSGKGVWEQGMIPTVLLLSSF